MIFRFAFWWTLLGGALLCGCTDNATAPVELTKDRTSSEVFVGDLPELVKRGTLRVGVVPSDFVGPEYLEQERYNADSIQRFCERQSLNVSRVEFSDWDSAMKALSAGYFDVL